MVVEINSVEFRDTLHKIPFVEDSWNDLISLIKVSTDSQAGIMITIFSTVIRLIL